MSCNNTLDYAYDFATRLQYAAKLGRGTRDGRGMKACTWSRYYDVTSDVIDELMTAVDKWLSYGLGIHDSDVKVSREEGVHA